MMICPNCFAQTFDGKKCTSCRYIVKGERSVEDLRQFFLLKNRYVIGHSIGAGGFGITYAALDKLKNIRVCVKEYFPASLAVRDQDGVVVRSARQSYEEDFKGGIRRFIEEARVIEEMEHIPGVVRVTDCFEENGTAYYVMEFLDGATLKSLVPEHGMELRAAYAIIMRVGRILDTIHKEKGYLHRDVSPENIMILPTGRVVLIDFGNAKNYFMCSSGYSMTLRHGFAPIEQYSGEDIQGPFTDLYALASTFYYMLTGKVIPRATERLTGTEYEPLTALRPDISQEISDIVDRALTIQPSERTRTVGDFLKALASVLVTRSDEEGCVHVSVSIDGAVREQYTIEEDKEYIVGRSETCDIVFPNCENVSKRHCRLTFDSKSKQFCIEDFSTNGTYVNYVRLEKETKYYAGPQDLIILANTRFRLILGE